MLQDLVVALLVIGCTAYAAWTLMPSAGRRSLAARLLKLPWPNALAARLKAVSRQAASGCGCDGCDRAPKNESATGPGTAAPVAPPVAAASRPIVFHRRIRH